MRRVAIDVSSTATIKFAIDVGEEENAEHLVEMLEEGDPPPWLQTLVIEEIMRNVCIEGWEIISSEPEPDEELNFDLESC